MALQGWIRTLFRRLDRRSIRKKKSPVRMGIEELESRAVPASLYWLGGTTTGNWSEHNWATSSGGTASANVPGGTFTELFFDTTATNFSNIAGSFSLTNDLSGLSGLTITINDTRLRTSKGAGS